MRCTGTVTAIENNIVTVEVLRRSACEACHKSREGCTVCSLLGNTKKTAIKTINNKDAEVGDKVVLETESRRVLLYAFLVFILPVLSAAAVWALSVCTFAITGGRAYLLSLFGLIIPFLLLFAVFGRKKPWDNGIRIISVIKTGGNQNSDCFPDQVE